MNTTIIVPTYNEAENIPELVERLKQFVKPRDIFVVDDNSPDGTASIAAKLGCRVLLRHRDKGLSAAVVDGLKHISEGKVVIMDADLQHPPELVLRLLKALDRRDIAVASRYYRGGGTEGWSGKRKLVSMVANLLGRPFAPKVKDRMSGFFAVRREAVPPLETLNTKGFKILLEILARSDNATTLEIPYTFAGRKRGESKLKSAQITEYLRQLIDLPFKGKTNFTIRRWLKFALIGGTGAGIVLAGTYILTEFMGYWYMASLVITAIIALIWNFSMNAWWTFKR